MMKLTSTNFIDGQIITDPRYSAHGGNVFPALSWSGIPESAKSLAVLCHDKNAGVGGFWHFQMVEIDPHSTGFPEGAHESKIVGRALKNDTGDYEWSGPNPPKGDGLHEYRFYLYALPYKRLEEAFQRAGWGSIDSTPNAIGAIIHYTSLDHTSIAFKYEAK